MFYSYLTSVTNSNGNSNFINKNVIWGQHVQDFRYFCQKIFQFSCHIFNGKSHVNIHFMIISSILPLQQKLILLLYGNKSQYQMPLTLTLTVSYSLSSVCVAPAFSLWSILNLLSSVLQTISNRIPVLAYRHKRLRFYKIPLPLQPQKERKL